MRKIACIFLLLTICLSLTACSAVGLYQEYVSASGSGVPVIFGQIVLDIQTDSMAPTFKAGDTIICEEVVDPSTLKVGDIITYWTVIDGQRILNTHRIVEIYDGGGYLIFATKGDNNTHVDSWTVHESEIVGKYVRKAFLGIF